jgi:Escherichia/Staphylococcus phage prohead protease
MHEVLRNIKFELKELSDAGDFTGYASIYGNIDNGNDVVEPGAFDKSIAEYGNKIRLMDGHKVRIGVATISSDSIGLKTVGKINTKKQSGAEALSDLRFYRDNGFPMGMSIGYQTLKADLPHQTKDGARHLKELRAWEATITEFPMNEKAQVTSVKAMRQLIDSVKADRQSGTKDFAAQLREIQLYAAPYQIISAMCSELCEIRMNGDPDAVALSGAVFDDARAEYVAMLPDYMALLNSDSMGYMSLAGIEKKAGALISQAEREEVERAIKALQSVIGVEPGAIEKPTPTGVEDKSEESTDVSEASALIDKISAALN